MVGRAGDARSGPCGRLAPQRDLAPERIQDCAGGEVWIADQPAIPVAFAQYGFPAQAGLRTFERDELEEHRIVVSTGIPHSRS
jgi:hypothetical protein